MMRLNYLILVLAYLLSLSSIAETVDKLKLVNTELNDNLQEIYFGGAEYLFSDSERDNENRREILISLGQTTRTIFEQCEKKNGSDTSEQLAKVRDCLILTGFYYEEIIKSGAKGFFNQQEITPETKQGKSLKFVLENFREKLVWQVKAYNSKQIRNEWKSRGLIRMFAFGAAGAGFGALVGPVLTRIFYPVGSSRLYGRSVGEIFSRYLRTLKISPFGRETVTPFIRQELLKSARVDWAFSLGVKSFVVGIVTSAIIELPDPFENTSILQMEELNISQIEIEVERLRSDRDLENFVDQF